VWIRKSAYGGPVVQVAAWLGYRSEKYQFSVIVHYQMFLSLESILSNRSLDRKSVLAEKYYAIGFMQLNSLVSR
jgi:hypothetical protein